MLLPKQCLHNGVLTFRVKELVAGRNGARGGGAVRCSRRGFARIPLRFDAPAVVSREFRPLVASSGLFWLPLWFRVNSGLFWLAPCSLFWPLLRGPLRLRAVTAHTVGRGLRFDAPAVVSREFRCVSMLPLWFRANSVAFRSREFLPLLASSEGGHVDCGPHFSRPLLASFGLFWPSSLFAA